MVPTALNGFHAGRVGAGYGDTRDPGEDSPAAQLIPPTGIAIVTARVTSSATGNATRSAGSGVTGRECPWMLFIDQEDSDG